MGYPIPFSVTFFAPEEVLCKYTSFRPSPESFHPLASPVADSVGYMQDQLFSCFMPSSSPVRLQLHRQTQVDVLAAGMHASALRERTDISASKVLASGIVYSASRDVNSIVWAGQIVIPPKVRCGGFVAKGIRVTVRSRFALRGLSHGSGKVSSVFCVRQDCLVLTLAHPGSLRNDYADFCQSVPIRLTTETYGCGDGVVTISDLSSS